MSLETGARLGPYEIVALLGRGGMGEVYRALDTRIHRTVAIKVLTADPARHESRRQRFAREAQVIAQLNHPHICALYDVGSQDGVDFLVMEFLDGQTLAERLRRGPLPLAEALTHAVDLARAVARAHDSGVFHRDIKPGNVMLTATGAKLLDFGLARQIPHSDTETDPGSVAPTVAASAHEGIVGTFAYMAPEQIEGRACDERSDIFSLGIVIHEMIAGRHPFAGREIGVVAAILSEGPTPLGKDAPGTPPALERIVATCLARKPADRWQHAADLAHELAYVAQGSGDEMVRRVPRSTGVRRIVAITAAALAVIAAGGVWRWRTVTAPRSLVVLPCRANAADAQAYCDGLADTVSARLATVSQARDLQMTSTYEARQRGVSTAAAARAAFGVTLALEGTAQASADRIQVTYVLVDAKTLRQVDTFTAAAAPGEWLPLQNRVAEWAVSVLALKLDTTARETLTARAPTVPGAYEFYLQGRGYLLDFQQAKNVETAIDLFKQALAIDPNYAAAHAGLGQAYFQKYTTTHDRAWVEAAASSCEHAVTLGPRVSAAHVCSGLIALETGRFDVAANRFSQALALEPANDEAVVGLARTLERQGKIAEAEAAYQRAVDLRPQYWATRTWLGTFYRDQARYADAAAQYEAAVRLTPDNARAHFTLGGLYIYVGRYQDAVAEFQRAIALNPSTMAYSNLGVTYYRMRNFAEAVRQGEAARALDPTSLRNLGNLARAYYRNDQRDRARATCDDVLRLGGEALKVNPADVDVRLHMSECLAIRGDKVAALSHVMNAGITPSGDPHVIFFVAMIFDQIGERDQAVEWLKHAAARGLPKPELAAWVDIDDLRSNPDVRALLNAH